MPLPTISLRAAPEHHALIREMARALRTRPGLSDTLTALLAGPSSPITDILARLDTVERWIAERNADAMRCDTNVAAGDGVSQTQCDAIQVAASSPEPPEPVQEPSPQEVRTDLTPSEPATEAGGDFPARMKTVRKTKGWSQADLAQKTGLAKATIGHIESRYRPGTLENRAKIADALGIEA